MQTYRIFTQSTREPVDTVEAHVLAKAYRSVWRSTYASDPADWHALERLDLVIDFGPPRSSAGLATPPNGTPALAGTAAGRS
jgi:hypothetical protein